MRRQKEARKKDLIAQGRFSEAEPFFKSMDDMPETLQQMMHLMVNSCANGVGRFVLFARTFVDLVAKCESQAW